MTSEVQAVATRPDPYQAASACSFIAEVIGLGAEDGTNVVRLAGEKHEIWQATWAADKGPVRVTLRPVGDVDPPGTGDDRAFQERVGIWLDNCFGPEIARDLPERNHRFLEEALELVQANSCTASEAHQLVDYVFGRPVGEIRQEVGGVMVTLAALCRAIQVPMPDAGEDELARVWIRIDQVRAKQAAKPKHGPLPTAPADCLEQLATATVSTIQAATWDGIVVAPPAKWTDNVRRIVVEALNTSGRTAAWSHVRAFYQVAGLLGVEWARKLPRDRYEKEVFTGLRAAVAALREKEAAGTAKADEAKLRSALSVLEEEEVADASEPLVVHCGACAHDWTLAMTPMPIADLATAMHNAVCPRCGACADELSLVVETSDAEG